jgi:hypothetical protein
MPDAAVDDDNEEQHNSLCMLPSNVRDPDNMCILLLLGV